MIKKILTITITILILTSAFLVFGPNTSSASISGPSRLNVYIGPTNVLADNNTYNCIFIQLIDVNGIPSRAEKDTIISLSSSTPGVGTVDQTTTIVENATYATANFTTTSIPGTATITATAPNYATVISTLTTIGPYTTTTKPANLTIYIAPNSILADNNTYNCIFIQLIDVNGIPSRAEKDTIISLSSSTPGVGTVDQTTTIVENATYATANFTTTYLPGTTDITATASDYSTVQTSIRTIGPYPYSTTVYGFPSLLPADNGVYAAIMVQLQDLNCSPARAPNDVQVSLFSTNTTVGNVTSNIIIPAGQTYATANFTSSLTAGNATISAVGHGYKSTQTTITTQNVAASGPAEQLKIFKGPSEVLADNNGYKQIAVELQDAFGNIANATSDTIITVASADNTIATTDMQITIPQNFSYALATVFSTYRPGTVNIIAATNNIQIDQQPLTTVGFTPSKLAVYLTPSTLPSDNSTYQIIQVQLQDGQGRPTRNPDSNTTVRLYSSDSTVGTVTSEITIPFGQTQATANFTATYAGGLTTITAIGSNYTTGQATLTTYGFAPSKLAVYLTPSTLPSDNSTYQIIQVQLQDGQGRPTRNPDSNTTVRLYSSDSTVGTVTSEITIPFGQTQATANFTATYAGGLTTITAIGSNYTTGQATLTTYLIDYLEITATATPLNIDSGNTSVINANVTANGTPTTAANVSFISNNGGTFTIPIDEGNGIFTTIFTAANFSSFSNSASIVCIITVNATKTGYISTQTAIQITVAPVIMPTPTTTPSTTPSPSPSPSSSPLPSPTATSTPSPTSSATPTSTLTPVPTATPTPVQSSNTELTLSIKDSQGNPLADTSISSITQPSGMLILVGVTNSTGYVTFINATAGSYSFNIIKEGYQLQNEKFDYNGQSLVRSISLSASNTNNSSSNNLIIIVAIAVIAIVVAVIACIKFKIIEISRSDPR